MGAAPPPAAAAPAPAKPAGGASKLIIP
jgi:hypothetical protein